MFQMDAQEMEQKLKEDPNYVPTLEDEVEAQRQRKVAELKEAGKGTPVTPETFQAWQEAKRKRKAEEAKKLVEAELKKKKGGKGLSVLSGRALYEYNRDLFLDDAAAAGATELDFDELDDEDGNEVSDKLQSALTVTE
jgi:DRG Family Regulatory Proteins, Tma46